MNKIGKFIGALCHYKELLIITSTTYSVIGFIILGYHYMTPEKMHILNQNQINFIIDILFVALFINFIIDLLIRKLSKYLSKPGRS